MEFEGQIQNTRACSKARAGHLVFPTSSHDRCAIPFLKGSTHAVSGLPSRRLCRCAGSLIGRSISRERRFWPIWLEMLRVSDDGLEGLFGDGAVMSIRAITLGLVGSDGEAVAELASSVDIASDARAGLVEALARLMCEGRYPREKFIVLIDRLATLEGADNNDRCKWCVEEAIVLGGIGERAHLLDSLWRTDAFSIFNDADKAEARERLAAAAARPGDLTRFEEDGIAAPKAPADALRWLRNIQKYDPDSDRIAGLTWRARGSLAGILQKTDSPDEAMSFEELDGFFHFLVIGPDTPMPSEYLREIWGEGPVFDNVAQAREVMALMQQHWNAIAERAAAIAPPVMWLEPSEEDPPGTRWACGFARGVGLRSQSWSALAGDEAAIMALDCILALESGDIESWERSEFLHMLGDHITTLAEYWREQRSPRMALRAKKWAAMSSVRAAPERNGRNVAAPRRRRSCIEGQAARITQVMLLTLKPAERRTLARRAAGMPSWMAAAVSEAAYAGQHFQSQRASQKKR